LPSSDDLLFSHHRVDTFAKLLTILSPTLWIDRLNPISKYTVERSEHFIHIIVSRPAGHFADSLCPEARAARCSAQ